MTTDQPPPEAQPPLTARQRANVGTLLTPEQKPATPGLLLSLAETVRNRREHDHPKWEDLYCLNQTSFAGERMGAVLRRLLDTEAELERLRRLAAAEQAKAGKVTREGEITRASVLREEARRLRRLEATMSVTGWARQGEGLLRAALVLDEQADLAESSATTVAPGPLLPWAGSLGERDLRSMLAAVGATLGGPRPPSEALHEIEDVLATYRRIVGTSGMRQLAPADAYEPEPEACRKCRRPFDPAGTRHDGQARNEDTPWCRRCVDRCHESTDAFHECVICRTPNDSDPPNEPSF